MAWGEEKVCKSSVVSLQVQEEGNKAQGGARTEAKVPSANGTDRTGENDERERAQGRPAAHAYRQRPHHARTRAQHCAFGFVDPAWRGLDFEQPAREAVGWKQLAQARITSDWPPPRALTPEGGEEAMCHRRS